MPQITALDYRKDFIGTDLVEGDIVAVVESTTNGGASLETGQVIGFTAKRVRILLISKSRSYRSESLKSPHHLCKLGVENMKEIPVEWIQSALPLNR